MENAFFLGTAASVLLCKVIEWMFSLVLGPIHELTS